jgi:hypothetical protein
MTIKDECTIINIEEAQKIKALSFCTHISANESAIAFMRIPTFFSGK